MHTAPAPQLAFDEQPAPQSTGIVEQQIESPLVRLTQASSFEHVSGQLEQMPLRQLGVAPSPHVPHSSVLPHPSSAVPHDNPRSAHVFGTQTQTPFWHSSWPWQVWQV